MKSDGTVTNYFFPMVEYVENLTNNRILMLYY